MTEGDLTRRIQDALTAPGKSNSDRVRMITRAMESEDYILEPGEDDPFAGTRNRAIEITDLDGQPTFVTVGVILERVEQGWIPGLMALTEDETVALDHVLRIWEHEARFRLNSLIEAGGDHSRREKVLARQQKVVGDQHPWVALGDMTKAQNAYRDRLSLPKHPHGTCCTKYTQEADHAITAATR